MFDDIFNHDSDSDKDNNFKNFYFGKWFIDPAKIFKGSLDDSRNSYKWLWPNTGPSRKPRFENICVATMNDQEHAWYKALTDRQNNLSKRVSNLQRQLDRAQHEQAIMDIDISAFNSTIRERYKLDPDTYPELIIGEDAKHIYQRVDLSKNTPNEE